MSENFYKFGCSGKDYVEAFNFRVAIKKDVNNVKEFTEITKYLFLILQYDERIEKV